MVDDNTTQRGEDKINYFLAEKTYTLIIREERRVIKK